MEAIVGKVNEELLICGLENKAVEGPVPGITHSHTHAVVARGSVLSWLIRAFSTYCRTRSFLIAFSLLTCFDILGKGESGKRKEVQLGPTVNTSGCGGGLGVLLRQKECLL